MLRKTVRVDDVSPLGDKDVMGEGEGTNRSVEPEVKGEEERSSKQRRRELRKRRTELLKSDQVSHIKSKFPITPYLLEIHYTFWL
jgi:hypothetical protein